MTSNWSLGARHAPSRRYYSQVGYKHPTDCSLTTYRSGLRSRLSIIGDHRRQRPSHTPFAGDLRPPLALTTKVGSHLKLAGCVLLQSTFRAIRHSQEMCTAGTTYLSWRHNKITLLFRGATSCRCVGRSLGRLHAVVSSTIAGDLPVRPLPSNESHHSTIARPFPQRFLATARNFCFENSSCEIR
jgi:hypothetical protein